MNPCECGCGLLTAYRFVRGHYQRTVKRAQGYKQAVCPERGIIEQHVLIAEAALGHRLPTGAEVHHVDGLRHDNSNVNLVICQDVSYHRLLHARARVVKAGGNPNTDKRCRVCAKCKPLEAFAYCARNGANQRQGMCRACTKENDARRRLLLKANEEAMRLAR